MYGVTTLLTLDALANTSQELMKKDEQLKKTLNDQNKLIDELKRRDQSDLRLMTKVQELTPRLNSANSGHRNTLEILDVSIQLVEGLVESVKETMSERKKSIEELVKSTRQIVDMIGIIGENWKIINDLQNKLLETRADLKKESMLRGLYEDILRNGEAEEIVAYNKKIKEMIAKMMTDYKRQKISMAGCVELVQEMAKGNVSINADEVDGQSLMDEGLGRVEDGLKDGKTYQGIDFIKNADDIRNITYDKELESLSQIEKTVISGSEKLISEEIEKISQEMAQKLEEMKARVESKRVEDLSRMGNVYEF